MAHMAHELAEVPIEHARRLFLDEDHAHGCAETTFVVLKSAFGLDAASDPGPAMALNGGIAYSGGLCGAIAGAALALGILAGRRVADHAEAKRVARELTADVLDAFGEEFGATDCRSLIGMGLRTPEEHAAFLSSGIWRDACMRQIEFVIARTARLGDAVEWDRAVTRLHGARPPGEAS